VSDVEVDRHYDAARASAGDRANYVDLEIERIVAPDAAMVVETIAHGPLALIHWAMPASGMELSAEAVVALDALWLAYAPPRSLAAGPDELTPGLPYSEGVMQVITINRYERSPEARRACIEHWGTSCVVCDFSFALRYGTIGVGFIHVHHLDPLGASDGERLVDPVADLRPVCPNCHAMLHRRDPPMTIEELRRYIR
jgi:5-methylcytosine-specific restriction protein A